MNTTQKLLNGKFSLEMQVYGSGEPLLYLHGAGGLMPVEPFLEDLGAHFKVYAPQFPGYGESTGSEHIDDIADAVLFYHELMDELGIPTANLVGHSMGGMLAAEVAAFDVHRARKLVLIAPAGFWIDEVPIPDLFAAQLTEIAGLLFHDPEFARGANDDRDTVGLQSARNDVRRAREAACDGKQISVADPRPGPQEARLSHCGANPALVGRRRQADSAGLREGIHQPHQKQQARDIKNAGHMVMYEQQEALVGAIRKFLKG